MLNRSPNRTNFPFQVTREMKRVDGRLEELESRINEEARRLDRLHPLDAKHNVDVLEHDLRQTEDNINTLFSDVQTLRDGRYPQASDLHKRCVHNFLFDNLNSHIDLTCALAKVRLLSCRLFGAMS